MTQIEHFAVNPAFFRSLSEAERLELFKTWRVTGALCERLWRMSEFQGPPPPDGVELLVRRSHIEDMIRDTLRQRGLPEAEIARRLLDGNRAMNEARQRRKRGLP